MKSSNKTSLRLTRYAAAFMAAGVILTTGCANMSTTAANVNANAAGSMTGVVHGGNQVVTGATVNLLYVGQVGVGVGSASAANGQAPSSTSGQLLATTTTDNNGAFNFTQVATATGSTVYPTSLGNGQYQCGNSNTNPILYIEVKGGNTTGNSAVATSNTAAAFFAPVGRCTASASAHVVISELTTAAMAAATGQYVNPANELLETDGILVADNAITNALSLVNNLVDPNTGTAITSKTIKSSGGFNTSNISITVTPETAKLNTIGNILSSCVNQSTATSGTSCSTLFAAAVPPATTHSTLGTTYPTATDTLLAAVYMQTNASDSNSATNRTNLYNLSPASGAVYQPTITAVPNGWNIALNYATNGTCDTSAGAASSFFNRPYGLAVDAQGNIWVSNASTTNSALVEMSNTGNALTCKTFGTSLTAAGRSSTVIDDQGNVWYGDNGNSNLYRYTPSTLASLYYPTTAPSLALTADNGDNVFYTAVIGGTGRVIELRNGATTTTAGNNLEISNIVGSSPYSIYPDSANDFWVTSGAGYVTQVLNTVGGSNYENGYNSTQYTVATPSVGVVVGPANSIYIASGDPAASVTSYGVVSGTANYAMRSSFPTATNAGGVSNARGIYIDGAQGSFVTNGTANSSTQQYSIAGIAKDASSLSPDGATAGGFQRASTFLNAPRAVIIDQAGNQWITNDGLTNSITEIVGGSVPIYQPFSVGLGNGRFQTIP